MKPARVLVAVSMGTLAGLAGCTSLSPTEDPMFLRLTDLEARLVRIERVLENQSLIQLANQLDQIQAATQELRGEVETLRHETENASTRQRELYLDVDRRLQGVEQTSTRAGFAAGGADGGLGAPAAGGGFAAPAAGSDQEAYQAAFDLLSNRRYDDASRAFRQFLETHPQSRLAHNAQYWLAETHYVRREFDAALPEFIAVVERYPQSDKVPDALLKVGYSNYELRRFDAARTALQRVMREFPDTTAARLAQQRLDAMARETG